MAQTYLYSTKANKTIYKLLKVHYRSLPCLKTSSNNNHETKTNKLKISQNETFKKI